MSEDREHILFLCPSKSAFSTQGFLWGWGDWNSFLCLLFTDLLRVVSKHVIMALNAPYVLVDVCNAYCAQGKHQATKNTTTFFASTKSIMRPCIMQCIPTSGLWNREIRWIT